MKETILFAVKLDDIPEGRPAYKFFHTSEQGVRHMSHKGKVVPVRIRQATENDLSPYFAWWDNSSNRFHHIFPSKLMVSTCLTYGIDKSQEAGIGEFHSVVVEELIS